ncbi:MAG: transcriptional regulator [Mucilaginibacter sp.]|nr:transcriptional regulator [Mucilaginibacter sp.]
MPEIKTIEIREDIKTFFMQTDQVPAGIPALFDEFEKQLDGFDGRHIYGVTECTGDLIYRVCIAENAEGGDADEHDLPCYNIPKGIYLCTTLKNWRENISQIPEAFDELLKHPDAKRDSICLEDYQSANEMLLMVQHK